MKPGGPFPPDTASINYNSFTNNETLYRTLEKLDARSSLEYEPIGETWDGRPIPYVRIDGGDTDVFYVTQQHGDEQHTTEAALQLLTKFAAGGRRTADILNEVTLHVIPRHNPDGWAPADETETPARENGRPADVCHHDPYYGPDQCGSVDPNRQHYFAVDPDVLAEVDGIDPDRIPDENPSPETQAMLDKADEVDADIVCDWYHQFTLRNDECELINASTRWPLNAAARRGGGPLPADFRVRVSGDGGSRPHDVGHLSGRDHRQHRSKRPRRSGPRERPLRVPGPGERPRQRGEREARDGHQHGHDRYPDGDRLRRIVRSRSRRRRDPAPRGLLLEGTPAIGVDAGTRGLRGMRPHAARRDPAAARRVDHDLEPVAAVGGLEMTVGRETGAADALSPVRNAPEP
ncbi:peptidase M14 carboxypeptidase A [Natrinema altunense JCM 12890]|uniref:Peptidase M14 carboxypeptidase A n=2 Tax=Natrinema altunense TaxID=222984 RepID=L9ZRQ1_NATA2|nr:peptidase M14 carboxypeptidase A [Natrinema altunense JCM 12890]